MMRLLPGENQSKIKRLVNLRKQKIHMYNEGLKKLHNFKDYESALSTVVRIRNAVLTIDGLSPREFGIHLEKASKTTNADDMEMSNCNNESDQDSTSLAQDLDLSDSGSDHDSDSDIEVDVEAFDMTPIPERILESSFVTPEQSNAEFNEILNDLENNMTNDKQLADADSGEAPQPNDKENDTPTTEDTSASQVLLSPQDLILLDEIIENQKSTLAAKGSSSSAEQAQAKTVCESLEEELALEELLRVI